MNKSQERNRVIPFMYIQQPHLKPPKANMQKQFKFQEKPEPIHIHVESEEKLKSNKLDVEGLDKNLIPKDVQGIQLDVTQTDMKFEKEIQVDKLEKIDVNDKQKLNQENLENPKAHIEENIQENVEAVLDTKLEQYQDIDSNKKLKKEKQQPKIRVPFNDLPLEEKCKYIKAVPMSTAKIRFEFFTTEGNYPGYFLSNKQDILQISPINGEEIIKFPFDSLIDIKMIGI